MRHSENAPGLDKIIVDSSRETPFHVFDLAAWLTDQRAPKGLAEECARTSPAALFGANRLDRGFLDGFEDLHRLGLRGAETGRSRHELRRRW